MEVTDPGNIHFETRSDESLLYVMLSEEWAERYRDIRSSVLEYILSSGAVSVELDFLTESDFIETLANRLICWLSVDLGPVSVSIGLVTLALYELQNRITVTGYEVTRTPAVFGKTIFGKSAFGEGWGIEPVVLD